MLTSFLKIAWRNLFKNKTSSVINIGGLAVGMAVAILIGLWGYDELTFNKGIENYNSIARVLRHATYDGTLNTDGSTSIPLCDELKNSFGSDFKYVVKSLGNQPHNIKSGDKDFTQWGDFMDADAPEMLSLKMLNGSRNGLVHPNSILLSASLAKKIFGDTDPTGKIIKIDNNLDVKVTGTYQDLPANSEFKNKTFIAPFDLWLSAKPDEPTLRQDWNSEFIAVYVQINPAADFGKVSSKIKDVAINHVSGEKAAQKESLFLQPMSQWHLYSNFENGENVTSEQLNYLRFYTIVGIFVLLLACINFMNLSTARSEKRAKEVGIRKTIGSIRAQLVTQFFCESLVITVLSFLSAIMLVQLVLPWFNTIVAKMIVIPWSNSLFWLAGIVFILVTGFMAGSYPAFFLSSFKPVKVLNGTHRAGRFAALPRQALVTFQFAISIALITGTAVVYRQIQYAKDRPVGYSSERLLQIQMTTPEFQDKFGILKDQLKKTGVVAQTARAQSPLTNIWNTSNGFDWKGTNRDTSVYFGTIGISYEYGKTIGWEVLKGRDFQIQYESDSSGFVINQKAAEIMGFNNPVGKSISFGGDHPTEYKILGVVKDMVMNSPFSLSLPTIYYLSKGTWVFIKINPSVRTGDALHEIQTVFRKLFPAAIIDYKFADEEYEAKFSGEKRIASLASFFAFPAIIISCLGLFGLASFVAEQRTKEIGIRKILGASVLTVWRLLTKDFMAPVFISLFISIPAVYYFMDTWLQNYAYREEISVWIFIMGGAGALLITLLTVSFQAIKTAIANPVKSLRAE